MKPTCAFYSINDPSARQPDLNIRFEGSAREIIFSPNEASGAILITISPEQARSLIETLHNGLALIFSPEEKAETPQTPSLPSPSSVYGFNPTPQEEEEPYEIPSYPTKGWLIRHEYKNLFYSPTTDHTRLCEAPREEARIFTTELEYQRACLGLRHTWTSVEISLEYLIGWKEAPNARASFWLTPDYKILLSKSDAGRFKAIEIPEILSAVNFYKPARHITIIPVEAL